MRKVVITGITGFLGSQIAERLIQQGISVIGLKRASSNIWRCQDFVDEIDWVDQTVNYQQILIEKHPDTIIHCAWIGVEAKDRENWTMQAQNIQFLIELLEIAKEVKLKKIIFLGSQAEYGLLYGKISESSKAVATTAYGSIKLACLEILQTFSELNHIEWIWIRLFSLFGEKENQNWLIPSIVKRMQNETEMDFTSGEQQCAYLYVKDFADIMLKILIMHVDSGIYNVSANEVKSLRSIITEVRDFVNPRFKLNFGVIPYRKNQSMHLEGDITKLTNAIGEVNFKNFNVALQLTLKSYLNHSGTI